MNAYSFYLYGSPFFWLSVLLPQSWLPYMMVPLLVLKFGVAGGGAFLYLRRYVKNENYAVLGACLYALSGFAVYNVFFNHFVDVVALFPYLLWALDEAIYENRHGLFAFWVAVNLLNNYFFFVGQVIFLCIYFVCKLTAKDFRLTGRKFGHLLWESVLGVAWVVCCCSRQCSVCCRTRAPLTFPPAGAFWPTQGATVSGYPAQLDPAAGLPLPHLGVVGGRDQVDEHDGLPACAVWLVPWPTGAAARPTAKSASWQYAPCARWCRC